MEKQIESLVFRRMTYADFRHINKVGGEEKGGGGQSYIDFPTADISLNNWHTFLGQNTDVGAGNRPIWEFPINSFGLDTKQNLKIFQRRSASVTISSQKIHSRASNRVHSWHPNNNFPVNYNPETENLVVYIAKTVDGEFWAGWFLKDTVPENWPVNDELKRMFDEDSAGYIKFNSHVLVDTANIEWPFYLNIDERIQDVVKSEEQKDEEQLDEDTSPKLEDLIHRKKPEVQQTIINLRQRNTQVVRNLKKLYGGKCQITGEELTFKKKNGELYSEVHHLIALGEDGSDSYANAIVVCPTIHRMLHYADVSEINLNQINNNKLPLKINGEEFEITWHPDHIKEIEKALKE
jgi:5-methylcytosine-specific restriction protein A